MIFPLQYKKIGRQWPLFGLLIGGYIVVALMGLRGYIKPVSAEFILGSLAIVSSLRNGSSGRQASRFGCAAMIFAALYVVFPAKTMLFISLGMAVLCLTATLQKKSNVVTIFSLGMMSPIFEYAVSVFSFPIKLYLTALAAKVMRLLQPDIHAEGNFIVSGSFEFSVDTACLGLHMLSTSMLAGLIMLSFFMKRKERRMPLAGILAWLLIVLILNILSNLIRIVCLVSWKIPPEMFMHDVVGIVCFVVYVIAPMLFLMPVCLKLFGKKPDEKAKAVAIPTPPGVMNMLLLSILVTSVVLTKDRSINGEMIPPKNIVVPGYTTTHLDHRVTKLSNRDALVYIKPIAGFFSSDHQPMICWSGSGYEFTRVQKKVIAGADVYAALLIKGNEQLHTAWWYDNGEATTISQLEWRWNALMTQQHYAIINVTATTPAMLELQVRKMLLLKLGKRP